MEDMWLWMSSKAVFATNIYQSWVLTNMFMVCNALSNTHLLSLLFIHTWKIKTSGKRVIMILVSDICFVATNVSNLDFWTILFWDTYNSLLVLSLFLTYLGDATSINWNTRFKIVKGICQGLHFLHKELVGGPLIHMNLVPNSIWLDDNWVPKIADFGLSRLFGKEQTRMYTVNVKGHK